jgi:hypothetical protein
MANYCGMERERERKSTKWSLCDFENPVSYKQYNVVKCFEFCKGFQACSMQLYYNLHDEWYRMKTYMMYMLIYSLFSVHPFDVFDVFVDAR